MEQQSESKTIYDLSVDEFSAMRKNLTLLRQYLLHCAKTRIPHPREGNYTDDINDISRVLLLLIDYDYLTVHETR